MKKRTQIERLVAYLRRNKRGITTLEAAVNLGICSLHSRITEARRYGHRIAGSLDGNSRHNRYRLV